MPTDYDTGLARNAANFVPLTPLDFIVRAADVYGERLAIVHGPVRQNWQDTYVRCRRLACALARAGIGKGDTVAALLPNTPAMIEAHFGVPMAGAVLNALNIRLDTANLVFMLRHGEARVLLADTEFADVARQLAREVQGLKVIAVHDVLGPVPDAPLGDTDYESFLASGDPEYDWK
ncbi:AMP-binding protein, partial [Paraburkholderia caribensis]